MRREVFAWNGVDQMPQAPKRFTPHGITAGAVGGFDHAYTSHQRGYTKAWYRAAVAFIEEQVLIDPRCSLCLQVPKRNGKRREYEVDHRIPPSSAGPPGSQPYFDLFWLESNWRLSCISCNASKQNG